MGKHGGKGERRSAAGRRKEDARRMKLISKNEVISDVVRVASTTRIFHCIAVARRRYFNFTKDGLIEKTKAEGISS